MQKCKDDHMGKSLERAGPHGSAPPPTGGVDGPHVGILMLEETDTFDGSMGLALKDARGLRRHGAKPAVGSLAMRLSPEELLVRHRGSWKGDSESTMPSTRLRDSRLLLIGLQEQSWDYLYISQNNADKSSGSVGLVFDVALSYRCFCCRT